MATGFTDGTLGYIRADWRQSDGRVQFFTCTDGVTWVQLGTDQSIAIASIYNDAAYPTYVNMVLGARDTNGNNSGTALKLAKAELYKAGVLVNDFNARLIRSTYFASCLGSTGETWIPNAFGSVPRTVNYANVGATLQIPMNDGVGWQLRDNSPNKYHALTVGGIHRIPLITPARIRYISDGTTTAQKLAGGTTLPANSQILRVRARAQSGTPNITLGTSSGGSQIVASVALSTTWQVLTIALGSGSGINTADASIWLTSSAANVVEIDIEYEPISS